MGRKGRMLLKLIETPKIEDLRNHSADSIKALHTLLQAGAPARQDPRRPNFYEVDNCSRVFYIHITPKGKVWLLAIWTQDSAQQDVEPDTTAARRIRASEGRGFSPAAPMRAT